MRPENVPVSGSQSHGGAGFEEVELKRIFDADGLAREAAKVGLAPLGGSDTIRRGHAFFSSPGCFAAVFLSGFGLDQARTGIA